MGRLTEARGWMLLSGSLVLAAFTAFVAATGGIDTRIAGFPLRARGWERPAVLALVTGVLAIVALRARVPAGARVLIPSSPFLACAAILAVALGFGSFTAGGADSYGYVSQAELLARGRLTEALPPAAGFDWPDVPATLTPLAYRRGAAPDTIAPIYPPGLPLLMAPLAGLDRRAVFAVVPICAVLSVWLCFQAGLAIGGPAIGRIAAVLLTASPTFLTQSLQPMSDVPVTAGWLGALLLARRDPFWSAPAAGVLASLAVLVRPNLLPLAGLVVAATAFRGTHVDWRRAAACIAGVVPGLATLAGIQYVRYGSATASGYGSFSELFSLGFIGPNLSRYPRWLAETHTIWIWTWIAAPLWIRGLAPAARAFAWIGYVFCLAVVLAYLPYLVFRPEEWFYTRFLLPALPLMIVFDAAITVALARRVWAAWGETVALTALCGLTIWFGVSARSSGAFTLHEQESKFPAVGAFARDRLPANAVVLSMQHSGSLRYYADRLTVRWDLLEPRALDRAVASMRAAGREPYVVIDRDEDPAFRERFGAAGQAALARMTRIATIGPTSVYAIAPGTGGR